MTVSDDDLVLSIEHDEVRFGRDRDKGEEVTVRGTMGALALLQVISKSH